MVQFSRQRFSIGVHTFSSDRGQILRSGSDPASGRTYAVGFVLSRSGVPRVAGIAWCVLVAILR